MEDLNWVVYKHTNLTNDKVYIGITHDIRKRWRGNGCAYKSNRHFWQAIEKYGWDGFKHEIVFENISHTDACKYEIELISKYNSCDRKFGYNKSPGGDSPLVIHRGEAHHFWGKKLSEEHRKKLSKSHKGEKSIWYGKHLPEETRKKLRDAHKGKKLSEAQKELLRQANLGRKASDETRRKMSEAQKGRVRDPEVGKRISDSKEKKSVAQLSLSRELLQVWPSVSSASREYGISTSSISKCCKNKLQSAGGFVWAYAENVNLIDMTKISDDKRKVLIEEGIRIGEAKQRKVVMQLTLEGELVKIWESLTEAAEKNGMSIAAICRCCKGEVKTSGGYIWKYRETIE